MLLKYYSFSVDIYTYHVTKDNILGGVLSSSTTTTTITSTSTTTTSLLTSTTGELLPIPQKFFVI